MVSQEEQGNISAFCDLIRCETFGINLIFVPWLEYLQT